ncbi:MAG: hypothetical protein ACI311_00715 [Bacilli bacterium]
MKKRKNILSLLILIGLSFNTGCNIFNNDAVEKPGDSSNGEDNPSYDDNGETNPDNSNEGGNSETTIPEEPSEGESTEDNNENTDDTPTTDNSSKLNILKASGYKESAFVEFENINDSDISDYQVFYKLDSSSSFTQIDSELIRKVDSNIRCDILGLKEGTYTLKIVNEKENISTLVENINVTSYDRSGFAHYNNSQAIGGYNNDGTVKNNATVVYVTEDNKNTVQASIGGSTYTGIVKILQAQNKSSNPLIIRFLGTVGAATWSPIEYESTSISADNILDKNGNALPKQNLDQATILENGYNTLDESTYTKLNDLTNKIKYNSSDNEFDSYYNMCDVSSATNVTLEGVGTDACLFQWGFTFKSSSYIEVRNLTFEDYTEDACSFEGSDDATTVDGFTSGHIWFHNNNVLEGKNYWDVSYEQDKHEGDGSIDLKRNKNITISYNYFYNCHKTGLVGGDDTQKTTNITYHHNYYDSCVSRLPLARQAIMHMYNNYYYKSSGTNMSIRANAYALIENSIFESCSNPVEIKTNAVVKSYNNQFTKCTGTNNATIVSNRTETVTNSNIYNQNFDTDSSYFYYDSTNSKTNVTLMNSLDELKSYLGTNSGTLKNTSAQEDKPNISDDNSSIDTGNESEEETTKTSKLITFSPFITGSFVSAITNDGVTITVKDGKTSEIVDCDSITINDTSITKYVNFGGGGNYSQLSIQFQTSGISNITVYYAINKDGRYAALFSEDGSSIISPNPTTSDNSLINYTFENVAAGSYAVASSSSGLHIYAILIEYI